MADTPVLIVGGGPTGLAAALFLSKLGIKSRIIEPKLEISMTSNALAVNPRSLDLLDHTGVVDKIVQEGFVVRRLEIHQQGRRLGEMHISPETDVGARFPMTIIPQWRTESILIEALKQEGIELERGLKLTQLEQDDNGVNYTLSDEEGREHTGIATILLGADGAHSKVRKLLGFEFPGSTYPETWTVIDVIADVPGGPRGHVDFRQEGVFLALPYSATHWRLIGCAPGLAENLPTGWTLKEIRWRSDFKISHRLATGMAKGRVCIAGDAAHIHAPVGGRGLNLGVEDAFVFAHCAADALNGKTGRLEDYGRIRHETDQAVLHMVDRFTRTARLRGWVVQTLRSWLVPIVTRVPAVVHMFERMLTGLDHEVRLT